MVRLNSSNFCLVLFLSMFLPQAAVAGEANSVSQYGITWTFKYGLDAADMPGKYQYGQFINGDYWVVAKAIEGAQPNVIITHIDPCCFVGDGSKLQPNDTWVVEAGRVVNGSMLNPGPIPNPYRECQGYDSWVASPGKYYLDSLNVARHLDTAPLILEPHSSLISTISRSNPTASLVIKTAAVLTVLASAPPAGSFRPPYAGTSKPIKNISQIQWSLLQKLPLTGKEPSMSTLAAQFQRVWLDHGIVTIGRSMHPTDNMPNYGQSVSRTVGEAALMLHLNYTDAQKQALLYNFLQLGIDNYGIVQAGLCYGVGACWRADGGHASGRKWPILFAGLMLNDNVMKNIGAKSGAYKGHDERFAPADYVHFGEDDQTYYIQNSCVARCIDPNGNYYTNENRPPDQAPPSSFSPFHWEDIGLPEWGKFGVEYWETKRWQTGYRRSNTAICWAGWILAARVMGAKTLWNHDALFDYQDRYMAVEAQIQTLGGQKYLKPDGQYWVVINIQSDPQEVVFVNDRQDSAFAGAMWDTYRSSFGPVWSSDPNNSPPVLAAIGNKSVNENAFLTFAVSATDADGDTVTCSVQGALPSGATFVNKIFSWTPTYSQAGTYQVTFVASDGQAQDFETITITVVNVNRPPELAPIGNKSVNEGGTLSFSISATDPDGETITYSVQDLPAGAAFVGRAFTWTPGYTQAGTYQVTFVASDGQAQDSEQITITVNNVNRTPALNTIGDKTVEAPDSLAFSVSANDPDGDAITYTVQNLPSGASFTGQSFSWTVNQGHIGNYQVTFVASDGYLQDSQTIAITVTADATAPTVTSCSPVPDAIQVPLNNLVVLHLVDNGKGVDANSVIIRVNNNVVYTGNVADYAGAYGRCRRTGTKADYTFVYQPQQTFDFEQLVTVAVNAADLAGNVMAEHSYSFRTEMRSFGKNKSVGSSLNGLGSQRPATARDSSGNVWVAWHAGQPGSRDIYVSRLISGAENFRAAVRLTTSPADECNAAVAVDVSDRLYVIWQDNRRGNWDVYVSTSTDGTNWSAERRITDSNNNQTNPVIAVDRGTPNTARVAWQDDRAGNQDIYVAGSSDYFLTSTETRITSNVSDQTQPAVAVDSQNTLYVVWTDARNGSADIYGAASNNGWTNVLVASGAGNQSSPAIAAEAAGSILHLLWANDASGNRDIYYAASTGLPSSPLTGSNIIDDKSGADQLAPAIITAGSAGNNLRVFACWQDKRIVGNTSDTDLYFVELTAPARTNIFVGDDGTNSNQSEPAIGVDKSGYPYLVWTDNRSVSPAVYYAGSTFAESNTLASSDVAIVSGAVIGTAPDAISSVDDVSVTIPAGAYGCDIKITISRINNAAAFTVPCLNAYDFGPSGIEFSQPVTITIPYDSTAVSVSPLAYWYNPLTGALSQQGITNVEQIVISPTLSAIRFKTTHFTQFLIGGAAASAGGGGGGGGCSLSSACQGSLTEFILPYVALAVVMVVIKCTDVRRRKPRTT